jgi:zinc resistance-associated protein
MAKIQQARAKFLTETLDLRKTIAAKRLEMRTFYAQPKKDTAKIKALANELIDLRAQVAKKRNEYMGDYAPFFAGGRGGHRGGRPGPGMGMGGGPGFGPGSCFAPVGPPSDEPLSEN